MLTESIPGITHLVVLGSGGMKGIDMFKIWGKKRNLNFEKIYKEVSSNPTSEKKISQQSYKWWAEELNFEPMPHLSKINIPMFFAMGSQDDMNPVESLYCLRDEFARLAKDNLTIKFYENCDHTLVDSMGKNHRKEFMRNIYEWLH